MSLTVSQTVAAPDGAAPASADQSGLVYELTTQPDPLRVSPAQGALEHGDIVIVGSALNFNTIEIQRITVGFPVGDLAHSLTEHLRDIEATVNHEGSSWPPAHNEAEQEIVFNAPGGTATVEPGQGVTIQLRNIPINRQVGSVPLTVIVSWRREGTTNWRDDVDTLTVGKFPPDFTLANLKADPIALEHSGSTTLTWEASDNATYKLLYGTAEIDVTNVRTYTVPNLKQTTPFYLRGIAQSGNTTVERTLTSLVTVNVPDLEVTNLFVRGTLSTRMVSNLMRISFTTKDGWGTPVAVNLHSGANPPAMAIYNNRLHCVHRALIGDNLQWSASIDGIDWLPDQTLDIRSPNTPALAALDGMLYCVYRAMDGTLHWISYDGNVWSTPVPMSGMATTHAPAMCELNGKLHCSYRAPDETVQGTTFDGADWSAPQRITNETATGGPGTSAGVRVLLEPLNVKYVCFANGDSWTYGFGSGGVQWSTGHWPADNGPTAVAFYDGRWYFVRRGDDAYEYKRITESGGHVDFDPKPLVANLTKDAPTLIVYQDALHMYYMR
ncbi:hypothetical protein LVX13_26420 [Streptomyces albulus]|uniref:hypothetical protein n=1 Tax=Streptomyces noursei TaxID=1971 RepID=UPI001F19B4DF|nr:hypothetical protein [Streptomyces noursei]MCE4946629.1 hypothetical protein [Streptomyces noursei]